MKKWIIILLALVFISGCALSEKDCKTCYLPNDAKEVKALGNNWFYFELDDVQYLYNSDHHIITAVPKTQPERR